MNMTPEATRNVEIIDLDSIRSVVDHTVAYDAVRSAFSSIAAGTVESPQELAFHLEHGGEMHIKGAHFTSTPWIVFKVASGSFPAGGNAGCSMVIDATTGEPAAILNDGGWLTEMRTAAAGAVAADLLAPAGALSVAILGTGLQARYQLEALRSRRDIGEVTVWGRTAAKVRDYADEMQATPCDTVFEATATADLIVTTTPATAPILLGEHFRPGVHVTALGADMVGKHELDASVLDRATIIAADDLGTCRRVGELQHASTHADRAVPLASLVGAAARDRSPTDITVADLCGIGAADAAIAAAVLAGLAD